MSNSEAVERKHALQPLTPFDETFIRQATISLLEQRLKVELAADQLAQSTETQLDPVILQRIKADERLEHLLNKHHISVAVLVELVSSTLIPFFSLEDEDKIDTKIATLRQGYPWLFETIEMLDMKGNTTVLRVLQCHVDGDNPYISRKSRRT